MVKEQKGSDGLWYVHLHPFTGRAVVCFPNEADAKAVAAAINGAVECGREEIRSSLRELIGAAPYVGD